jgi:hypothetical protein
MTAADAHSSYEFCGCEGLPKGELGRPHEVDGFERVDRWRIPPQKSGFAHNQVGLLKRLTEPHIDAQGEMLMKLLTDEQAKEQPPKKWNSQAALICISNRRLCGLPHNLSARTFD